MENKIISLQDLAQQYAAKWDLYRNGFINEEEIRAIREFIRVLIGDKESYEEMMREVGNILNREYNK